MKRNAKMTAEKEIINIRRLFMGIKEDNKKCECCGGDTPSYWKDEQNNAFIDSTGS